MFIRGLGTLKLQFECKYLASFSYQINTKIVKMMFR
jgi:hypothetical protein